MTIFSSLYGSWLDQELHTDQTELFTTAKRKQAVNKGAKEFARLTECLQRRATVTLTGGTAEYDLNSTAVIPGGDFLMFSKEDVEFRYTNASAQLTILAGDDLPRRDVHWLNRYRAGWQTSTVASSVMQLPETHYVRADGPALFLGFTPVPSTGSSASIAAVIPYLADCPTMSSATDEPYTFNSSVRIDLRPYHQAAVHYAAYLLEKLRPDEQASQRQLQFFMGYVSRYLQNLRVKGGRAVMTAKNYFNQRAARV